jgi:hypothetical protein
MFSLFAFFELFKGWTTGRQSYIEAANIVMIVSLTLLLWWLQFRSLLDDLYLMASALLGQRAFTSIMENQISEVAISNASIWLVIDRFLKVYGPMFLYFSIALFFLFYMIYHYFQIKKIYEEDLIYSLQFCVAICIGIALMVGYFVIAEPIRAASYGLVFATILCGLFFYRERQRRGLITSITVIITIVCMLTIMTLYSSPLNGLPNSALSYGDKNGIDWILEYQDAEIPLVKEELSNYKYSEYHFEITNATNSHRVIEYSEIIRSHFGYNTNRTLGDSFAYLPDSQLYMMTTELMRLTPYAVSVDRRYRLKSFTDSDFIRLKNDPSVNLLYSNNEFEVWKIAVP